MLTQADSDGFTLTVMKGIIDYQKYAATYVTKDDMYIVTKRGQKNILPFEIYKGIPSNRSGRVC